MMEKQMPARVDDVIAVEIEDKPGCLAKVLKPLMEAKVNVLYSYAFVGFSGVNAVMIFRFSDNDKAIEILQNSGIKIFDAEAFGILENGS